MNKETKEQFITRGKTFAERAHTGQFRKSTGAPYISHPLLVASLIEQMGFGPDVIVAAFNHDTVEDTTVTIEDIHREFGDTVAKLVTFNTEDKTKSWEERKSHTIETLKNASLEEKALVVADKYANFLELKADFVRKGEDVWKSFKRGRVQQGWYFQSVANAAIENLADVPELFLQYKKEVDHFFGN